MHSLRGSGSKDDLIFKIIVKSDAEIHMPTSSKKNRTLLPGCAAACVKWLFATATARFLVMNLTINLDDIKPSFNFHQDFKY